MGCLKKPKVNAPCVVFLAGSVGAGKSFVASIFERFGFVYLGIDDYYSLAGRRSKSIPLWKDTAFLTKAWAAAENELFQLARADPIVFESTGINHPWWHRLYKKAKRQYGPSVFLVVVHAPLSVVWRRLNRNIGKRPQGVRFTFSQLERVHRLVRDATWEPDNTIVNRTKAYAERQVSRIVYQIRKKQSNNKNCHKGWNSSVESARA